MLLVYAIGHLPSLEIPGGIVLKIVIRVALIVLLITALALLPCNAQTTGGVQVISASPGETINFHGTGTPGSSVTLDITTSIAVGVENSSGQLLYSLSLTGFHVPSGSNSFSITANPVSTMTIWGSYDGIGLSHKVAVANDNGTFSISNVPGLTYNIGVKGIANGPDVSMDVSASTGISVDDTGNYTASVNTNGMPAGIYDVYQDSVLVAIVYLGVPAPITSAPMATVNPTDTAYQSNVTATNVSGMNTGSNLNTEDLVAVLATLGACSAAGYLLVLRKK